MYVFLLVQLATASSAGTVIRVFCTLGSTRKYFRMYELRRGFLRSATISTLTFCLNDQFLVSSSNTETVHIFKLGEVSV